MENRKEAEEYYRNRRPYNFEEYTPEFQQEWVLMFEWLQKRRELKYDVKLAFGVACHCAHTYLNQDEYEYADNFRVAIAGKKRDVDNYLIRYENGCCGSYDTLLFLEDLDLNVVPVLLGFNYGH